MPFNYLLTNLLVDVPSAVGAIFLDNEGEAIEWVTRHDDPFELKVEGAYQSIFIRQLQDLLKAMSAGSIESYAMTARNLVSLTQALPDGYYVVLVIDRSDVQARARYHLRRTARVLARELV